MRRPTEPHFRSGLFVEQWFAVQRELEGAAEEGRPPSGEVLYGLLVKVAEAGWQAGYSDGRNDAESRRGFVDLFDKDLTKATRSATTPDDDR